MNGSSGMHAVSQGYIFIILIYGALKMCCVFDIKKILYITIINILFNIQYDIFLN